MKAHDTIVNMADNNLLIHKYPQLVASEWDYEKNDEIGINANTITYGSKKKAWWRCKSNNKHSYEMAVKDKVKGHGCPYCNGRKVLPGYNDILTLYNELIASEWDYEKNNANKIYPSELSKGSNVKANWHCNTCNGYYIMAVSQKTIYKRKCPYCINRKVLPGYNDFASQHSELLSEWDYERNDANKIRPDEITSSYSMKIYWKCSTCKGSYKMLIYDRLNGRGCPYCAGNKVLKGYNDLASCYPELVASEWNWAVNDKLGIKPDAITKNSNIKASWKCQKYPHSYMMKINNRISGHSCPYCAGNKVLKGFNDLQSCYPKLVESEWNWIVNDIRKIKPDELTIGSGVKANWHCTDCNGDYDMAIYDKTDGHGCPYCTGRKALVGFNDLASCYPKLVASEWNWRRNNKLKIYPSEITKNSGLKTWWICNECSHEWQAIVANRTYCKSGCPVCAKHSNNHISNQENEVAEYIMECLHELLPGSERIRMERSITFKEIYASKDINVNNNDGIDLNNYLKKELDIYMPELELAIEYDGDYWHDDYHMLKKYKMTNDEVHVIKSSLCKQAGVKLLFITEHNWVDNNAYMKHLIFDSIADAIKTKCSNGRV